MLESNLPDFRAKTIKNWPQPFLSKETHSFSVSIHGIELCLISQNSELIKALKGFFPVSWQLQKPGALKVEWRAPDEEQWDRIVDPNCQFEDNFISQRDFLARTVSKNHIQVLTPESIDDGFFNFLRALLPIRLLELGKVLFHSSCVVNNKGEAFLFFGPSGAGKTTISRLCAEGGAEVLGDDMNLISVQGDHVYVEAAAVGQRIFDKKNFGQTYPIKKAFWLQQGPLNRVRHLQTGQMGLLLSSFANLFWEQLTSSQYSQLFELLSKVHLHLDVNELEFRKDNEVWDYVQSNL